MRVMRRYGEGSEWERLLEMEMEMMVSDADMAGGEGGREAAGQITGRPQREGSRAPLEAESTQDLQRQ